MSLRGKLTELSATELFQLVALTRKTGKLLLTHEGRQGVVVFRGGRVVFAASDALRSSFSQTLAEGRLVAAPTFIEEVKRELPGATSDSGRFLVEYREPSAGALEAVIKGHIQRTVAELVKWRSGEFVFERIELPEGEDIALDADWFVLPEGVDSNELLLSALAKLDELERGRWERDLKAAAMAEVGASVAATKSDVSAAFEVLVNPSTGEVSWVQRPLAGPHPDRDLKDLRSLVGELKEMQGMSPSLTAEVTLLILRYAAQVVNRGVLFASREEHFQGIGQFGLRYAGTTADERVRKLRIPRQAPSALSLAAGTGQAFVGRPPSSEWTSLLVDQLGGGEPDEVAVVPLVVDGAVVALLYGDNLPAGGPIGAVDGLEILMHEIGLAVEKAKLERRLADRKRAHRG